ncbi:DUF5994 family protein [Actinomycetospora sp. NBRC 106378]|uniref:DUF5994 family protein n=1 Tax=Actinomycetospora sp. NBRC 106378 TaxID=3032208 RepID=UPI0024A266BD|nr:DUF5994 family protein [Actinomycetospora sp. NBRC 106378]GLZ53980.1 hypothetical protein Acsp07_35970 [Actinomycetospora sp. NBRC 106378]
MSPAPNPTTTSRLRLKPQGPTSGYVDGAWWPRSDDLSAELPPLLTDLAPRVDPVARVAYHLDDWGPAPRRLPRGQVRLEGFRTTAPHTVTLVGPAGVRLVLLVIPPSTAEPAAEQAMAAAVDPADRQSPADLLAAGTTR